MGVQNLSAGLTLAYLAAVVSANPLPEANAGPLAQLSLPPLIPSVPGFTDPIVQTAPPLPVLQVPTPPLASPPFTGSDLKPKKIGYFWTGAGDNQHAGTSPDPVKLGKQSLNSSRFPRGL